MLLYDSIKLYQYYYSKKPMNFYTLYVHNFRIVNSLSYGTKQFNL